MTDDQHQQVCEILRRLGSPRQYPDRRPGDFVDMPLRRPQYTTRDAVNGMPISFVTDEPMSVRLEISPEGDRFIVLGLVL